VLKLRNFLKGFILSFLFIFTLILLSLTYYFSEDLKNDLRQMVIINDFKASIENVKLLTLRNYSSLETNQDLQIDLKNRLNDLENNYKDLLEEIDKENLEKINTILQIGNDKGIKSFNKNIIETNQLITNIKGYLNSLIEIFMNEILDNPNLSKKAEISALKIISDIVLFLYGNKELDELEFKKNISVLKRELYVLKRKNGDRRSINYLQSFIQKAKMINQNKSLVLLRDRMNILVYDNSIMYELEKLNKTLEAKYSLKNLMFTSLVSITVLFYILTILSIYFTYLGVRRKAKELTKIKNELEHIVEKDELTELGNRIAFIKEKNQLRNPTLILLNIDNFKQVNESYGIEIGDFLLKSLANTIKDFLSKEGLDGKVYRLGADDFGILLEDYKDKIEEITEKLIKYVENKAFKYGDLYIPISVSAGIALDRPLFEKADMALRYVRESRLKYAVYSDEMNIHDKIINKINTIKTIKRALQKDGLFLVYQPIKNLKTEEIEKYEVLVRLEDEKGRILYPGEFLDIAKEARLYGEITKKVLEKTFKTLDEYDVELSVNLSVEDIVDENIRFLIRKYIKDPFISERLTFEILENSAIENYKENFKEFINEMKSYGVKIAIDDFGSGYSNFAHILNLKPDFIKVDGSLIKEIDIKEENRLISETIVSFCHQLGIKTVAEFVWNKEVYKVVKEIGFDYGQGFYISKPIMELPVEKKKKEAV